MKPLLGIILIGIFSWMLLRSTNKKSKHNSNLKTRHSILKNNNSDVDTVHEEKSHFEHFNFYEAQEFPAKGRYHITYIDQRGLTTERDISIKRVYDDNGRFAIAAHCHWRNRHHSFIDDSIQSAVDLDTGKVVESVAQHAIAQYENSGDSSVSVGGTKF